MKMTGPGHVHHDVSHLMGSDTKLITGGFDKMICVWSINDGIPKPTTGEITVEEQERLEGAGLVSFFTRFAVMPDGRVVVSGHVDGTMRVWDLGSGRCRKRWTAHTYRVDHLSIVNDGETCISSSFHDGDHAVRVWETSTWTCLQSLQCQPGITEIHPSMDGGCVIVAALQGTSCWDVAAGSLVWTLDSENFLSIIPRTSLPQGSEEDAIHLITQSPDNSISIYDAIGSSPTLIRRYVGHTAPILTAIFPSTPSSSFRNVFQTRSVSDNSTRVWDNLTGEPIFTLHQDSIKDSILSPTGKTLHVAFSDRIESWDIPTSQLIWSHPLHTPQTNVTLLTTLRETDTLLVHCSDGYLMSLHVSSGSLSRKWEGVGGCKDGKVVVDNGRVLLNNRVGVDRRNEDCIAIFGAEGGDVMRLGGVWEDFLVLDGVVFVVGRGGVFAWERWEGV
ncbi:hypothetical protein HDU67_002857 [Dinochytrium kinnereticum]|nr:hypothetical protein HDU67_002857 [Dinochytrium kinnereticum]